MLSATMSGTYRGPARGTRRTSAYSLTFTVLALFLVLVAAPGSAYWSASGSGPAAAATGRLAAPVDVTVPERAVDGVEVLWTAGTSGQEAQGYYVTRHAAATPNGPANRRPCLLEQPHNLARWSHLHRHRCP